MVPTLTDICGDIMPMIFNQLDIVTLGRLATMFEWKSLAKQAILRKIMTEYDITTRIADAIPTREELDNFWLIDIQFGDLSARLAFFRKFWCNDIQPLTAEVARNLIGQDICVLMHYPHGWWSGEDRFESICDVHDNVHRKMEHVSHIQIVSEEDSYDETCFEADDSIHGRIDLYESGGILCYGRDGFPYYAFLSEL